MKKSMTLYTNMRNKYLNGIENRICKRNLWRDIETETVFIIYDIVYFSVQQEIFKEVYDKSVFFKKDKDE